MDYGEMSEQRKKNLGFNECEEGTTVLYCPKCEWNIKNAGMKPVCPFCTSELGIVTVDFVVRVISGECQEV